jgi:PKD repeat protein
LKSICIYISILCCIQGQMLYGIICSKAIHPAPIPNFQISHFCLGDTTYFTNTTQMGVFYIWDIYNVNPITSNIDTIYKSTSDNISFVFPSAGTYTVELTANNGHIVNIQKTITVKSGVTANFDYQLCGGFFTNLSVCYDSCFWDFGDGNTSTENSPIHFYNSIGIYTVTLIAKKNNQSDTVITPLDVSLANDLDGSFSFKILKDSVLYYINDTLASVPSDSVLVFFQATDSVSGTMTQFHWSFGDGTVADLLGLNGGRKVYHHYANRDTIYTVFLLSKTLCLNAFSSKDVSFYDHPLQPQINGVLTYPNPLSEGIIHVLSDRYSEITNISLLNYLSQPIGNYSLTHTPQGYDIDITDIATGLYFIRIFLGNETITKKIIKN